mmetsp:Transcript_35028/g.98328  ORF Transcript_35028/g.98328 Transcript_35028/m.98328 type:complete len:163 (-) Transcript_35028:54-542(-)
MVALSRHGPAAPTAFEDAGTGASYGGLMSQGYVPPGQFEDLLNLIRQSSAAAERAMNAAKYAEMAASAAGAAGQQAVVRAMHMANAPGAPTAAPFSPGTPEPGTGGGVGTACGPEPGLVALWAAAPPLRCAARDPGHSCGRRRRAAEFLIAREAVDTPPCAA